MEKDNPGSTYVEYAERGKEAVSVELDDVTYTVKDHTTGERKDLLSCTSGTIQPGKMTVILGPSGSGKTTLLNVLSGKKTGEMRGAIYVNGRTYSDSVLRRISGLGVQETSLYSSDTVREHFKMAEKLRYCPVHGEKTTDEVIDILSLQKCQDNIVGEEKAMRISGGEKKRVSIGMEMLNNKPIIYLDEPTSGLDALRAHGVLREYKKMAEKGTTVVVTLHQPSEKDIGLADEVVLMAQAGVLYWGPLDGIVPYFAKQGFDDKTPYNIAEYFFYNVLGVVEDAERMRYGTGPANMPKNVYELQQEWSMQYKKEPLATGEIHIPSYSSSRFWREFMFLMAREMRGRCRSKKTIISDILFLVMIIVPAIAIIVGFCKHPDMGKLEILPLIISGTLYPMMFYLFYTMASTRQAFTSNQKAVRQDIGDGYYAVGAFYLSKIGLLLIPAMFGLITYIIAYLYPAMQFGNQNFKDLPNEIFRKIYGKDLQKGLYQKLCGQGSLKGDEHGELTETDKWWYKKVSSILANLIRLLCSIPEDIDGLKVAAFWVPFLLVIIGVLSSSILYASLGLSPKLTSFLQFTVFSLYLMGFGATLFIQETYQAAEYVSTAMYGMGGCLLDIRGLVMLIPLSWWVVLVSSGVQLGLGYLVVYLRFRK